MGKIFKESKDYIPFMALDDNLILEKDDQYKRLKAQKESIHKRLLERKKEVLKHAGVIADSPEQLKCDKHKSGAYKTSIGSSRVVSCDLHITFYECDCCSLMVSNSAMRSHAYTCHACGTVTGDPKRESKMHPLGHCNIETYYCRICDSYIGKCYSAL